MLRPHGFTIEDRERRCLGLLASAMFAEASELPTDDPLRGCLKGYVVQLLHPTTPRRGRGVGAYEIRSAADIPVFRRLATLMDGLSLTLGPRSAVGRTLANWAARITLAAADAERRARLHGPPEELLVRAAALLTDEDEPLRQALLARHPELAPAARDRTPPPATPREPAVGRVWSRVDEDTGRRARRRRT